MTTRPDATPLSIGDRYYLLEAGIAMIEEGLDSLHEEAVEEGTDPDDFHLLDNLDGLRTTTYAALLGTMINNREEGTLLVAMMKQNTPDNDE